MTVYASYVIILLVKELPINRHKKSLNPMDTVHEAALAEDRLRHLGTHPNRIRTIVHIPLARALAMLATSGVDVSTALPPEKRHTDLQVVDPKLTPLEELAVDHLVDTIGIGYEEAIQRVRSR